MHKPLYKKYLLAAGWLLVVSVAVLWSWNTVAELFGAPQAQYKHAVAALVVLVLLKSGYRSHGRNLRNHRLRDHGNETTSVV